MIVLRHQAADTNDVFVKPGTIKNRFSVDYYILVVPDNFFLVRCRLPLLWNSSLASMLVAYGRNLADYLGKAS